MSVSELIIQLESIIARLRDPQDGCPWDLELTFEKMIPHLLEECYEAIETLRDQDYIAMPDELGDVLMQVITISKIAEEQNLFTLLDVLQLAINKLIRRHPHVFQEGQKVTTADEALANWNAAKNKEQQAKTEQSILANIPFALPALLRAEKIQKKCSKVGFDWDNIEQVCDKVAEELAEVKQEIQNNNPNGIAEEIGDLFFACVNLARHANCNSEELLSQANRKFSKRFNWIEQQLKQQGKDIHQVDNTTLEELWQQSKLFE